MDDIGNVIINYQIYWVIPEKIQPDKRKDRSFLLSGWIFSGGEVGLLGGGG